MEKPARISDDALERGSPRDSTIEGPAAPPTKQARNEAIRAYWTGNVSANHAYTLMLVCCLISGFVDSTLYNAYGTFVSMQTGNTIFVGLGASGQNNKPYGWARSLLSIVFFVLGSFCFSRFNKYLGARRRVIITASFLLQSIFIFITAGINQGGLIDGTVPPRTIEIQWNQIAPIALLSFQAAGQIVGARAMGVNEIPTVVVTSMLCDLMSDPDLAQGLTKNAKRNRRATAFSLTLIGAIAGGWMSKATMSVQAALWLAGGLKFAITCAWAVWPGSD